MPWAKSFPKINTTKHYAGKKLEKMMISLFKKIFRKNVEIENKQASKEIHKQKPENNIDLASIKQFDDVWIKCGDNIFEGWVVEKIKNLVYISYTNEKHKLDDAVFTIERPLNRTFIEQNNKILYLNKDDIDK